MHQRFTVPIDDQNWHQGTPPAGHETLVPQEGRGEGCDATRSSDTAAIREKVQTIAALRQINAYLAKFVPQTMQRLVAVNPTAPALSKCERDVSVLFLRISSAAALRERLAPGTRNRQVEHYFSTFLDHIYEADGELNEITGDGFMAIFQAAAPQRHAMNAAKAALAIVATTEALNKEQPGHPLAVRMGLNSGAALVGLTRLQGRSGTRSTFTATGTMTILAARLAGRAAPGQILIGPETLRRVGTHYAWQKLGCESLKNLAEPVDIYRLLVASPSR